MGDFPIGEVRKYFCESCEYEFYQGAPLKAGYRVGCPLCLKVELVKEMSIDGVLVQTLWDETEQL